MVQVSAAALTHPGLRRESNEDAFCARPDLGLFVVADGMGGHEAGEVASGLTIEVIESFMTDTRDADLNQTWPFPYDTTQSLEANRLIAAVRLANRRVAASIAANAAHKGMATTAAAVLVSGDRSAHIAHVGDSRVYVHRPTGLQQLTDDHSWVSEQVRAGLLSDADAQRHPWRNVVTRAIAGGDDPEVEVVETTFVSGDLLLMCTDGLSSVVSAEVIAGVLDRRHKDASTWTLDLLAQALVQEANSAGGPDNITVILVAR